VVRENTVVPDLVGIGERHQRRQTPEEVLWFENQMGVATGVRPGAAQLAQGRVACRERLGGLLKYYYRRAA